MRDNVQVPLVSVVCTSYNNVDDILSACQGIVLQRVTFPVEIIIHDDASTDGTRGIIESFRAPEPFELRLFLQDENKFRQGLNPWLDLVFPQVRGRYVAICEGDDAWTDPYKLARQIALMEADLAIGMVHTRYRISRIAEGGETPCEFSSALCSSHTSFRDLLWGRQYVGTLTTCIRTSALKSSAQSIGAIARERHWKMTDYPLWLEIGARWTIAYLPEITGLYRHRQGSLSHPRTLEGILDFTESVWDIRSFFWKRNSSVPVDLGLMDRISFFLAVRFDSVACSRRCFRIYHKLRMMWGGCKRRCWGLLSPAFRGEER